MESKGWTRGIKALGIVALLAQGGWAQAKNALTPDETAAGYQLLFNGKNLDGWRSYNSTTPPNSWQVAAESTWNVIFIQAGTPRSSLLTSDLTYRNFDLMMEWNIASGGNSGVFIRYNKHNVNEWGGASGPEAQIGATNNSDATAPTFRAGTCYEMFPLLEKAKTWDGSPNYGKWQQFRIVAYEGHVAHYGNGIKLMEYFIRSPAWNTAYNNSKYATYPDYATVHPGSIYLQHHGEFGAEGPKFRNIRIRKLTDNPWASGSKYLVSPTDTTALKDLAFKDLILDYTTGALTPKANDHGLAILPGSDGFRIRFAEPGNYTVRTQDLMGRANLTRTFGNSNEAWMPVESARNGGILSVWSGDTRIHVGPIPANR